MALNVKAFLEKDGDVKGEIRRFTIPSNSKDAYSLLRQKVAGVFNLSDTGFAIFWQDTDGDFVTFSSNAEMVEAIHHSTDGVLRVFIRRTEAAQDPSPGTETGGEKEPSEEPKVHHPGVVCDGCDSAIYGPRYKCVICHDYDLCSACELKGVHPQHDKFKITHPQTAGGYGGYMPPHFRRWMHRFMKKCPGGFAGPFAAGPGGATCGGGESAGNSAGCGGGAGGESATGGANAQAGTSSTFSSSTSHSSSSSSSSSSSFNPQGDEFLNNLGANISAFLDPFGIDVSYEVRQGDGEKKSGHFQQGKPTGGQGQFSGSGGFMPGGMPGVFQWGGVFTNAGGCSRMPQGATPAGNTSQDKPSDEKPAAAQEKEAAEERSAPAEEKPSSSSSAPSAPLVEEPEEDMEEVTVVMEEQIPETPKAQDTPKSKEPSPSPSGDDDWTMLHEGETTTDGASAPAPAAVPCDGLYPNLKVTQSLEMMKAMGFTDDGGWLTRLLVTTDGDIAQALDTLKLSAQQAGKLQ